MKLDRDVWFREGNESTLKDVKESILASSRDYKRFRSRYLSVVSTNNPIEVFNKWKPADFIIKIKPKKDFFSVGLTRIIKRKTLPKGKKEISGNLGIFKNSPTNVWTIFTNDSYDFFKFAMKRFVEFYHPELSPIYLSSEEIRSIFYKLSKKYKCEILSKKTISKNPSGTEMNFTKPYPIEYVFEESYEKENYIDSIEFILEKDKKILLHGSISRSGVSTFYGGDVNIFYNSFLENISEVGISKAEMFSNKHQLLGNRIVHPINIVYDKEVFISQRHNARLISVLSQLEHSSVAVIHNNPYVHLTLLDYLDGSSFDIFVDSSNSISFIPRFNASFSSLNKVIQRIFERFGEGEIIEETEEIDSLESVFLNE